MQIVDVELTLDPAGEHVTRIRLVAAGWRRVRALNRKHNTPNRHKDASAGQPITSALLVRAR